MQSIRKNLRSGLGFGKGCINCIPSVNDIYLSDNLIFMFKCELLVISKKFVFFS